MTGILTREKFQPGEELHPEEVFQPDGEPHSGKVIQLGGELPLVEEGIRHLVNWKNFFIHQNKDIFICL